MDRRQFKLSEAQDNELKWAYNQSQDAQTKIRYQAVRLYGKGYSVQVIQEITGCSRTSLMEWCRAYNQFGVAGLVDKREGGNRAKLSPLEIEQLQEQLHSYTPGQLFGSSECYGDGQFWTVPDLAKLIERDYGVTYQSATSYRSLFDRCEFSCQRPEAYYRSRNELKALEFEQQLEKKIVDTAQAAPKTVILAGDEASLYLQATLQIVWAARGQTPLVKLHPGRESTHFYGALNLLNGQDIAMRSPMMNAETSALFLEKILLAYPDVPILLLWDRAPWHRGPKINAILEAHSRLEIVYFPPGAPDLNPQEHVWKATRRAVSHNHACKKLDKLADDFEDHLSTTTFPCSLLDQYAYSYLCAMSK